MLRDWQSMETRLSWPFKDNQDPNPGSLETTWEAWTSTPNNRYRAHLLSLWEWCQKRVRRGSGLSSLPCGHETTHPWCQWRPHGKSEFHPTQQDPPLGVREVSEEPGCLAPPPAADGLVLEKTAESEGVDKIQSLIHTMTIWMLKLKTPHTRNISNWMKDKGNV